MTYRRLMYIGISALLFSGAASAKDRNSYPWLGPEPTDYTRQTLRESYPAPIGYRRIRTRKNGFGEWLRGLVVKDGPVLMHDGSEKWAQNWHENLVDIDVGSRDLQQCADFAIRLRAEYLYSRGKQCERYIRFPVRNGEPSVWNRFKKGYRPYVKKGSLAWRKTDLPSHGYEPFREYLDTTFAWSDSTAVKRHTIKVTNPMKLRPGDIFVMSNADAGQGAEFGHVVMVMDVVQNPLGHRMFLLGQGFQPAQSFHILKNPNSESPWYSATFGGEVETPEWVFHTKHLRRFRRSKRCD